MAARTRKYPFQVVFDPSRMPGFQTRHASLNKFTGGAQISNTRDNTPAIEADTRDLRKAFKSGTVWQTLPSSRLKGNK